jgi:hypothetical protein
MGMYDTVIVKCAFCNKETESQTKRLGCDKLEVFRENETIYNEEYYNCIFRLKEECKCGNPINIIIKQGIIQGTTKEEPNYIEGVFGEVYEKDIKENLK